MRVVEGCVSEREGVTNHMMIDEWKERRKGEALAEDKEIKVRIPLNYHIKLHTVKVVRGTPISDTVKVALENYFAELRETEARGI